jgi:hypothetical protein
MRRVLGVTLTGLGAFLIGIGLLSRLVVPGLAVKDPLNERSVTTLTGTNAEYFSPATLSELSGVSVKAVSTTNGDVAAGTSSTAVWNDFTAVQDTTNNAPISYSSERLAFNRRTGELQNCCGAAIGTDTKLNMSGLGYVWPVNTQKKTYQIFDTTLLKPWPVTYAGTATVSGRNTYVYVEKVSNQQFGTQTLPGSLVGLSAATVTLPQYLTATNTYYVDPLTGGPLKVTEDQSVTLESGGVTKLVLLRADLVTTPASTAAAISTVQGDDSEITAVEVIVPLVGILLGIVLMIAGGLLVVLSRDEDEDYYADEDAVTSEV